jgi:23S rRNA pseudouridine2605 synthase
MLRIAKFLSDSGIASRREAERIIEMGRVSINGKSIDSPINFVSDKDIVKVDGKIIKSNQNSEPEVFIFHKPVGCICSASDPEGRKTIYDVLPREYHHLKYIGRLDYNTSGLLLMTTSGDYARQMTLPDAKIERVYIAKIGGTMTMDDEHLDRLLKPIRKGIKIDGIIYRPMKIERLDATDIKITIIEGKKNEIRKVFEYIGLPVRKLHRISYGEYQLRDLKPGAIIKCRYLDLPHCNKID